MMKAVDLAKEGFISVDLNEPVSKLIGRMQKENAGEAFVFDAGKLIGVFDHERLLRSKINVDELKAGNFQKKVPAIKKDASLLDVASKFLDAGSHVLPVFDGEEFLGGIHLRDLLLNGSDLGLSKVSVEEVKQYIVPLLESDGISTTLSYMYNNKLMEALVKDESNRVTGLVRHTDLMLNYYKQSSTNVEKEKAGMAHKKGPVELKGLPISNFMGEYEPYVFHESPSVSEVLKVMSDSSTTSAFVKQDDGYYIVTAWELLKNLVKSKVEYSENIFYMGLEDMELDEFTKAKVQKIASRQGDKLGYYIDGDFELVFHFKKYKKEGAKSKFSVNARVNSPDSKAISHRAHDWDAVVATRKAIESILNQMKKDNKKG